MNAARISSTPACLAVVAAAATLAIVAAAGWRTGLLAAVAGGAVAATRVRFSSAVAVALLTVTAFAAHPVVGVG